MLMKKSRLQDIFLLLPLYLQLKYSIFVLCYLGLLNLEYPCCFLGTLGFGVNPPIHLDWPKIGDSHKLRKARRVRGGVGGMGRLSFVFPCENK